MSRVLTSILLIFIVFVSKAQDTVELKRLVQTAETGEEKVDALNDLASASLYYNAGKSKNYAKEALSLAIADKYGKGIARSNGLIGQGYQLEGNLREALPYLKIALQQFEALGDTKGIASVQYNLGRLYADQSDYNQSMDYALQALSNFKLIENKAFEAKALEMVGVLFARQYDVEHALKYYKQALRLNEELGDSISIATGLINIAMTLHYERGEMKEAMSMLQEALSIFQRMNYPIGEKSALANMGQVKSKEGHYYAALEYMREAKLILKKQGDELGLAINTGNIGAIHLEMSVAENDKTLAEIYLDSAITMLEGAISRCKELNSYDPLINFYKDLSRGYELKGDENNALRFYQESTTIRDSIHSAYNKATLANMLVSHELAMATRDLKLNNQEILIKELELEKRRQMILLFAVSLVALACLVAITVYFLRRSRSHNKTLQKTNRKYAEKVEEQMESLKKHTKVLDEIAYMQAHDVREPVSTILGLAESFNYDDPTDPDNTFIVESMKVVTEKLDKAVREVIQKKEEL